MKRLLVMLLVFGSGFAAVQATQEPSRVHCEPSRLIQDISKNGAKVVVGKLWNTPKWTCVIERISTGQSRWISAAVALAPGIDAGSSEELSDGLFLALASNPAEVLSRLPLDRRENGVPPLTSVCDGRTDPPETLEATLREYSLARNAVASVHKPGLSKAKETCLTQIQAGEMAARHYFEAPSSNGSQ
jgi:hypothetical protein